MGNPSFFDFYSKKTDTLLSFNINRLKNTSDLVVFWDRWQGSDKNSLTLYPF